VWHKNETQEAFLMHVTVIFDAFKKCGTFKDYKKAQKAYVEAMKAAELAEAGLALINGTSTGLRKNCKKIALAKAKEAAKEALAKTQDPSQKPRKLKKQLTCLKT
jgi:hypothetical protein